MKLLHLDSSILGEKSVSRALSAAVVERLRSEIPNLNITYRDLAADPIEHLTLGALGGEEANALLEQFLDTDILVIGAGFYNFTIPSQLKAWIDRILIVGRTFRYGEKGPEGLAGGKRVIVTMARGGVYSEGSPIAKYEHAETLLRTAFGFIGIYNPQFIVADGVARGDEIRRTSVEAALAQTGSIVVDKLAV